MPFQYFIKDLFRRCAFACASGLCATAFLSTTLHATTPEEVTETERYLLDLQQMVAAARQLGDAKTVAAAAVAMTFDNFSSADDRVELARAALEQAEQSKDTLLRFAAQSALAQSLLYAGRQADATTAALDAMETAQMISDPALVVAALRLTGMVSARDPDPAMRRAAEDSLNIALNYYQTQDDPLEVALTRSLLGDLLLRDQRPAEALEFLRAAATSLQELDGAAHWLKALELKAVAESELGTFQDAFNSTVELYHGHKERWESGLQERLAALSVEHERALQAARADLLEAEKGRSDLVRKVALASLAAALFGLTVFVALYFGKRRAEAALRISNQALSDETRQHLIHIRELEAANLRLKEIDEERKRILGIAAHDLKNPIACIGSSLEMIEAECGDRLRDDFAEISELFALSHESIDYLNDLIQNILRARTEENRAAQLHPRPVDPLPILEQVIGLNEIAARKKKMTLWIETPEELWLEADPQGLREALDNLVSNAVKYSFPGAAIRVRLSRSAPEEVAIEVFDGGPGLRPEEFTKLFQPFTKLSARPTGGENSTGLGLSSVKITVDAMNGSIEAQNCEGGGACFRIRLREAKRLAADPPPPAANGRRAS